MRGRIGTVNTLGALSSTSPFVRRARREIKLSIQMLARGNTGLRRFPHFVGVAAYDHMVTSIFIRRSSVQWAVCFESVRGSCIHGKPFCWPASGCKYARTCLRKRHLPGRSVCEQTSMPRTRGLGATSSRIHHRWALQPIDVYVCAIGVHKSVAHTTLSTVNIPTPDSKDVQHQARLWGYSFDVSAIASIITELKLASSYTLSWLAVLRKHGTQTPRRHNIQLVTS